MSKLLSLVVVAGVLTGLSGCTRLTDLYVSQAEVQESAVALPPGFLVQISGKTVPIYGNDNCSEESDIMQAFFGDDPLAGQHDCIVIGRDTKTVSVLVGYATGTTAEHWQILRRASRWGDVVGLVRADGVPVMPGRKG